MISSFTIGNFKASGPAQNIPLIFGPNSAGKSGIIHGPLRVRQLASAHPVFMRMAEQLIAERSFRQASPESAIRTCERVAF